MADFRHRPPERIVDGQEFTGPLKSILEEAAQNIGYTVRWRLTPFPRSLHGLKDIVPRTIKNEKRKLFVLYLGPIGYQNKDILFLLKKRNETLINRYDDLYHLLVGVKRDTAYFDRFDRDSKIQKLLLHDDENMAMMFIHNRFDTMIVLDKAAIEAELKKNIFSDYTFANYRHEQIIGNYFGMSRRSRKAFLYTRLNDVLKDMLANGRVAEIYQDFDVTPPDVERPNAQ